MTLCKAPLVHNGHEDEQQCNQHLRLRMRMRNNYCSSSSSSSRNPASWGWHCHCTSTMILSCFGKELTKSSRTATTWHNTESTHDKQTPKYDRGSNVWIQIIIIFIIIIKIKFCNTQWHCHYIVGDNVIVFKATGSRLTTTTLSRAIVM